MKTETVKKIFRICKTGLRYFLKLILFITKISTATEEEEREPTFQEIMCGKQIPGSNEYFIPNPKHRKQ